MELLSQCSTNELLKELLSQENVVYRSNGNRAVPIEEALKLAKKTALDVGVSRVGEINQLCSYVLPVFQATRLSLYYHPMTGQNSSTNGKGLTKKQAEISCLMEAIEGFCAEPRNPILIRGSYHYLKKQHVLINPQIINHREKTPPAQLEEPLMWTPCASLNHKTPVLVPAEAVYFPFLPEEYSTRPIFVCSTNGLASGGTYLEALMHALYEVIERHYISCWEQGSASIQQIFEEDLKKIKSVQKILSAGRKEDFIIKIYSVLLKKEINMSFFVSAVFTPYNRLAFLGYGCHSNIETAINRALSESIQSWTTSASGSREDLLKNKFMQKNSTVLLPLQASLKLDQLKNHIVNTKFLTLNDELNFLLYWLKTLGIKDVFIANLTRHGVQIPVIKVIAPGMLINKKAKHPHTLLKTNAIQDIRYGINRG